ncbi:MAG: hypothetical protein KBE71_07640 [Laribacter sp.]|nr:hypothetical protein [Laribacter sp.]
MMVFIVQHLACKTTKKGAKQVQIQLDVTTSTPLVTRQKFSELVGLPVGVVNAQCDKGYWPTVRVGKYSLVNLALIQKACAEKEGFTI